MSLTSSKSCLLCHRGCVSPHLLCDECRSVHKTGQQSESNPYSVTPPPNLNTEANALQHAPPGLQPAPVEEREIITNLEGAVALIDSRGYTGEIIVTFDGQGNATVASSNSTPPPTCSPISARVSSPYSISPATSLDSLRAELNITLADIANSRKHHNRRRRLSPSPSSLRLNPSFERDIVNATEHFNKSESDEDALVADKKLGKKSGAGKVVKKNTTKGRPSTRANPQGILSTPLPRPRRQPRTLSRPSPNHNSWSQETTPQKQEVTASTTTPPSFSPSDWRFLSPGLGRDLRSEYHTSAEPESQGPTTTGTERVQAEPVSARPLRRMPGRIFGLGIEATASSPSSARVGTGISPLSSTRKRKMRDDDHLDDGSMGDTPSPSSRLRKKTRIATKLGFAGREILR